MDNIILLTDSYKISHASQYPPNTEEIFSYFESRGGYASRTLFFGLQYFLKKYLVGRVVTKEKIEEAEAIFQRHFINPELYNKKGWEYILKKYGGRLPVEIRAVPEGSIVPTKNVLITVRNTDPECYWLTNYLETLLVQVWYPTTVATYSFEAKLVIKKYLEQTGSLDLLPFKLHDFGFRGVSSVESAGIGGAAHLVNFSGTDTLAAVTTLKKYYGKAKGVSIPAAEHSTITSWGKSEEYEAFANMLKQYPTGLVAVVSDSYNIYDACHEWGTTFREDILNREGTLVIRPDSGYPPKIILEMLEILERYFVCEVNDKGFKVLPPQLRIIQGDGVDLKMIELILNDMKSAGWSADNIAFGCGGGLLQKCNRDTHKFAFKCSAAKVNGFWRDVYKEPYHDGNKKSKAGRLDLIFYNEFQTVLADTPRKDSAMQTVFRNGHLLVDEDIDTIEKRANFYETFNV